MDWVRRHWYGGRQKKKKSLREYSSLPDITHSGGDNSRSKCSESLRRIGDKLNDYNGGSALDLSSLLSDIDETDAEKVDDEENKDEPRRGHTDNASSGSRSSIAGDPSEKDFGDESIPIGHTEPTSLLKRCFSSHLREKSLDSLNRIGLNDDPAERESSLGYGTNESETDGRHGNIAADWRGIFSSYSTSNLSLTSTTDGILRENVCPTSSEPPENHDSDSRPTQINIYGSYASVQTNFETTLGTDDSRLSRYGSRARMITVNGSNRQKSIFERTESILRPFENEKNRVLTTATKKVIEKLTSELGDHVAVILGHRFDGKKYVAKGALARLTQTWEVAIIHTPEEMDDIERSDEVKTCFCIVDIFGKEFKATNLEKWEFRFDEMLSKASASKTGLILTLNKEVFDRYKRDNNCHQLFKDENIVDLASNCQLSKNDKIGMLKCHLQLFPDASKVVFTQEKTRDNVDRFRSKEELYIWNGYLEEIVALHCAFGFPKQAETYSSKLEYIQMRSDFFKRPLKYHCLTVRRIRESNETDDKDSAFAVESMFAFKGRIDKNKLEDRYTRTMTNKTGHLDRCKSKRKKTQDGQTIIEQLTQGLKTPADAVTRFNRGLINVDQYLLIQEKEDMVTFSSLVNHHAITLEMSKQFEPEVIRCATREFIYSCVQPGDQKELHEGFLFIHKVPKKSPVKDEIFRRLVIDANKSGNVSDVCSHSLMSRRWFTTAFLEFLEHDESLSEFVTKLDTNSGMSALVHGMNREYTDAQQKGTKVAHNLTEELLHRACWRKCCKNEQLKRKQEREALHRACRLGLYSTFVCLRKHLDATCLRLAVEAGSPEIVEEILRNKRFLNFSELSDIIGVACRMHCKSNPAQGLKIAMLLKNNDCSIDRKDSEKDPLIHEAVRDNNVHLLEFLNKLECNLNTGIKDKTGNRPLHNCVLFDSMGCAETLLKFRADPTERNNKNLTPLHLAVTDGNIGMVQCLARHKKGLNECDQQGKTALLLAVQNKRSTDMIKCLISFGADVTKKDNDGLGPLYYAIVSENLPAVKLLTTAGASVNDTDNSQKSMFEIAFSQKSKKIIEYLIDKSEEYQSDESTIPFVLIDHGATKLLQRIIKPVYALSCRNKNGDTLVKYAVERNRIDVVELLCATDSNFCSLKCNGMLPLHTAISSTDSSFEICNYLIASGASIYSKTDNGYTALHLACKHGRMDVIQLLLELDISLLREGNNNDMTALHLAVEHGHLAIVQILLIMGADPQAQSRQPHSQPLDIALAKRNFYNEQCARDSIEKVKTYDRIMAELRKRKSGQRRYASTMELRPR